MRMKSQSGFAQVNGTSLYYEVAGSGHPLVLIHGGSLDSRMWDDQFLAFAQQYRVVRYDVRGYGKSAVPTHEGYSRAGDLKGLMEHLGIAKAHVVGQSMGGGMSIEFALVYPEAATAIVAVGSGLGRGYQWSREWDAFQAERDRISRAEGVDAGNRFWLDSHVFAPALERPDVGPRVAKMVTEYSGWLWVNEDSHITPDPPPAKRLDEVQAPTLVIVGERDIPDCMVIADVLERGVPNARKIVLLGVGHMCNMEDPQAFNETVLSFLGRLGS